MSHGTRDVGPGGGGHRGWAVQTGRKAPVMAPTDLAANRSLSMPGSPILHYLLELDQIYVHGVDDSI